MQIEEIAIDGFGRFHDYHIGDLSPGLVVVQGANEAGKSTLLAFIQRVLFNFPHHKQNVNHYLPVNGGLHGGRLVLRDDSGDRFVLERHIRQPLRVILPDGAIGSDEVLRRILGGAEKTVYTNIFAFGLSELEDFQSIASDGVNQALFAAAAGLGDVSLTAIQADLEKKAGDLYKSGGSKPELNSLFRQIEDAEGTLRELQASMVEYDEKHAALEEATKTSAQLEHERIDLDRTLTRKNSLSRGLSDWQELTQAQEDLALLPAMTSFPEDGADTINRLEEGRQHLQGQLTDLEQRCLQSVAEEQAISIDDSLLHHRDSIRLRYRQVEGYRKNLVDLRETESQTTTAARGLEEQLTTLGDEWNEGRLRAWGTQSGPLRLEADRYEEAASLLAERRRTNESALAVEQKEIQRLTSERDDLQEQLESTPVSLTADDVQVRLSAVTRLRAGLASLDSKQHELTRLKEQAALRRETLPPSPPAPIPQWPAFLLGGAGVIVLLAGVLSGAAVMGAVAGVVLLIAAVIYWQASRRQEVPAGMDIATAAANFKSLAELIATAEGELSTLRDRLTKDARIIGINHFPDTVDVAQAERDLLRAEGSLKERARLERELSTRAAALQASTSKIEELNAAIATIESEEATLRTSWGTTIRPLDLDASASPKAVRDLLTRIDLACNRLTTLDEFRAGVGRLSQSLAEFEDAARRLLDDCGRPAGIHGGVSLDLLVEECEASAGQMEKEAQALASLQRARTRDEEEMTQVRAVLAEKEAAIASLLSEGRSTSVDEFLRKSRDWQKRSALSETIRASERRIQSLSGTGEAFDLFIQEMATIKTEYLRLEIERLEDERTRVLATKTTLDQEVGQIKGDIERLETSQEQSKLVLERAEKLELVQDRTRNWMRLMIAQTLLQQTITYYEQERQPAIVRRASEYLQAITGGRYLRIQYPLGSSQPLIVEAGERQKGIDQLSRGLAEQVYLAIRFGYIDEFTETAPSLPVIFDDILVNFDGDRSRQACRAIGELARRHQVLYFTCHPEMEAMLTEEVPGAVVVNLSAGTGPTFVGDGREAGPTAS